VGHLSLRDVTIAAARTPLLEHLTLSALPGELIAVVGPNGAGKTTLLRTIAGFTPPRKGEILIDGIALENLPPRQRARAVALIASDREMPYGTTLRDVVATGRYAHAPWWTWSTARSDDEAIHVALDRVDLRPLANRDFATLSSGERQRAWLALALAQDARLVLLDEPTSHLDPRHAIETIRSIRQIARDATTVVVVLHDLNEAAAMADRIAVVGQGRLLAYGPPIESLTPETLERAYAIPFQRIETEDGHLTIHPKAYRQTFETKPR
jgi:iron complex transport system ATP-binding protein